jgi:IS605 OrfB family transposase
MMNLETKRMNRVTYGIHKTARIIINHALKNNVGKILIGWNKGFNEITTNDKNNQWFKKIPLSRLMNRIQYLCDQNHIKCITINEAYTSKASYFDDDIIPNISSNKHIFSGVRSKRGLYITKEGKKINADINAALNILKRGNPDAKKLRFSGVNTPKRTYLF